MKQRLMKLMGTLKLRLIVATILCTAAVSLIGNLILYSYLSGIIRQREDRIDEIYLSTLRTQIDDALTDLRELGILCANDTLVSKALEQRGRSPAEMRSALTAQTQLKAYLDSSPLANSITTMTAFNTEGLLIFTSNRSMGDLDDYARITAQPLYADTAAMANPPACRMATVDSIKSPHQTVLGVVCPVHGMNSTPGRSYLYLELSFDILDELIGPYLAMNDIFVANAEGCLLSQPLAGYPADFTAVGLADGETEIGGQSYTVTSEQLTAAGLEERLTLYHCVKQTALDKSALHTMTAVVQVAITGLLLAVVLAVLMSTHLSRPVSLLEARLRRIAANDFSYDPEIEKSPGELGQIGRTINNMSMSIQTLLRTTEEMYNERRNIEIALLQSQVNPHFLYNTLDSIRWMAVIQKSPGIETMTRGLSNLLKNIAKGTQDRIPLGEELSLLKDYVAIQSVRYMEAFTFKDRVPEPLHRFRIVKLTLQPLVENAIFHGIEPTGECGLITVSGREDGGDLLLWVEDNGAGIPPEKLTTILSAERRRSGASLNGMGLCNVHKRLQLTYGSDYGLTVESELGRFTRITLRIPKEE